MILYVLIVSYYFVIRFILRRSIIPSKAYEFPEPVFKRARHLILVTFITAAGQITLDSVAANISSEFS